MVAAAKNKETGSKVAIKKITPMCGTAVDGKHTLREIRLMRHLGRHPNIISLKDLNVNTEDDELYVIMELMDTDLHRIIQSPQPLVRVAVVVVAIRWASYWFRVRHYYAKTTK